MRGRLCIRRDRLSPQPLRHDLNKSTLKHDIWFTWATNAYGLELMNAWRGMEFHSSPLPTRLPPQPVIARRLNFLRKRTKRAGLELEDPAQITGQLVLGYEGPCSPTPLCTKQPATSSYGQNCDKPSSIQYGNIPNAEMKAESHQNEKRYKPTSIYWIPQ